MGDYPLDANAVKKIRANIIDGNREQARSYYFLDNWVLKAIEEKQLFPDARPDKCPVCRLGVIVYSISSCQSCYHCSYIDCDYRGCSNARTEDALIVLNPNHFVLQECDSCQAKPGSPDLCVSCLHNRWVADHLNIQFGDRSLLPLVRKQ